MIGIPSSLLLTILSTPAGRLAGRHGARPFMVAGPLLMATGLLWISRIPSTSTAWAATPSSASSLVPPVDFLVDVLPTTLLFGLGIALLVAPLTTALMASIPVARAGLGSAINNAISRVGAPLVSAVLFIAITATFTPSLAAKAPGYARDSPQFSAIQPLAPAPAGTPADLVVAAQAASTEAFQLAMRVAGGLLLVGALVNLVGLERRRVPGGAAGDPTATSDSAASSPTTT
jgi:MFS family permease